MQHVYRCQPNTGIQTGKRDATQIQSEVLEHREKYKDALTQLQAERTLITNDKIEQFKQNLQQELDKASKAQAHELRLSIKEELEEEQSTQISLMQTELEEKSNQVRELNRMQSPNRTA